MNESIKKCNSCSLCKNQKPLMDKTDKCDVIWVGLSAKKVCNVEEDIPLSSDTLSGALIKEIEDKLNNVKTYKTNLVKCLPLDNNNKLRYPNKDEIDKCYINLLLEINQLSPRIVFLLGEKVSSAWKRLTGLKYNISMLDNFEYKWAKRENVYIISIYHPAYIAVYKRKEKNYYINKILNLINVILN